MDDDGTGGFGGVLAVGSRRIRIFLPFDSRAKRVREGALVQLGGGALPALAVQLDPELTRKTWREVLTFPGILSMLVMLTAFFPGVLLEWVPSLFGLRLTEDGAFGVTLSIYIWISVSMLGAWLARKIEKTTIGRVLSPVLIYLVGYGSLLCAITFDSYIKEIRGAEAKWDKTEKTGRVTA